MAIRNYGLSGSGIDVDQLVKGMMETRRARYDKMFQEKTRMEYKKQDYNKFYNSLKEFREKTVFDFRMSSQLSPRKATVADANVATVTASAEAVPVNRTLEVTALATAAKVQSSGNISVGSDKSTISGQLGLTTTDPFEITISDGINSKEITVDPTKSMYELVASINNAGLNVRANYDTTLDRFAIYNLKSGEANKVTISDASVDGQAFFGDLLKLGNVDVSGSDSEILLDGVAVKSDSNRVTVAGMVFELKAKGATTLDVAADIDKAVENVKAFVNSYNETIKKIQAELEETYYRSYPPLTTEQKKELSDDEIKEWTKRGKSGMLRNDPMLRTLLSDMRLSFSQPVAGLNGDYRSAIDLGITTASLVDEDGKFISNTVKYIDEDGTEVSVSAGGMLTIDEKKLRKALADDPDIVTKIFAADGETSQADGVSRRLYDNLKTGLDKIVETAGRSANLTGDADSVLAKRLDDINDRMTEESRRMEMLEARYYKQFDAMEVALQRMISQSSWLSQQFGS